MIKYIGSKRRLLAPITAAIAGFDRATRVLDLFSGTARVGHALKRDGRYVIANDHLHYAATLARCYVAADARRWREPARALLAELALVPPSPGYFTKAFSQDARYLQPFNAARVDAIRDAIAARALDEPLASIVLTSLMEAADRVDSTTGVQMAYLKRWSKRSYNPLQLRLPALVDGDGETLCMEAEDAASADVDVVYLDPPYNQHSYLGNYHVWETLIRWDAPERYGVAQKHVDCRTYKNPFNSKVRIREAFERVLARIHARRLVVSFNDEGYLDRETLITMLESLGHVRVVTTGYKRYVGAQIGIFSPAGEKVGRVSHLANHEQLFVVGPDRREVERASDAAARALAAPATVV